MTTRLIKGVAEVQPDWLKVYLITDCKRFQRDCLLDSIEAALKGGVRDLQLREKDLPLKDLHSLAVVLRQMTERYGARLYINGRVDIALMVEADGVHLPEDGMPANEVKACYPHLLVGVSTHSLDRARQAEKNGADFITFSPIFATPSKKEYGPPQGLEKLRAVCKEVALPVLALGGISKDRVSTVLAEGAHGIALISGIWNGPDIKQESFEYMQFFGRR
ncbi:Thiamin-phosphate pyrophosphorylase [hydrothermal vent metagenome]|uniref:thiamine phosphate synthase n=1 Tax=hydrothermal vent metagenome TaxID=652676 RepID=A0A3B1CL92_9ZZZZ